MILDNDTQPIAAMWLALGLSCEWRYHANSPLHKHVPTWTRCSEHWPMWMVKRDPVNYFGHIEIRLVKPDTTTKRATIALWMQLGLPVQFKQEPGEPWRNCDTSTPCLWIEHLTKPNYREYYRDYEFRIKPAD